MHNRTGRFTSKENRETGNGAPHRFSNSAYNTEVNVREIPNSYRGKNILQYPGVLSRHAASAARSRLPTVDSPGRPKDRWRIRFVRQEDESQLVKWREANDKRLWQKAVTILDNRSLIPEEIAKKVELPVDAIRGWITTYNHQGLAGLNPPRKKRSPGKKGTSLLTKTGTVLGPN